MTRRPDEIVVPQPSDGPNTSSAHAFCYEPGRQPTGVLCDLYVAENVYDEVKRQRDRLLASVRVLLNTPEGGLNVNELTLKDDAEEIARTVIAECEANP